MGNLCDTETIIENLIKDDENLIQAQLLIDNLKIINRNIKNIFNWNNTDDNINNIKYINYNKSLENLSLHDYNKNISNSLNSKKTIENQNLLKLEPNKDKIIIKDYSYLEKLESELTKESEMTEEQMILYEEIINIYNKNYNGILIEYENIYLYIKFNKISETLNIDNNKLFNSLQLSNNKRIIDTKIEDNSNIIKYICKYTFSNKVDQIESKITKEGVVLNINNNKIILNNEIIYNSSDTLCSNMIPFSNNNNFKKIIKLFDSKNILYDLDKKIQYSLYQNNRKHNHFIYNLFIESQKICDKYNNIILNLNTIYNKISYEDINIKYKNYIYNLLNYIYKLKEKSIKNGIYFNDNDLIYH